MGPDRCSGIRGLHPLPLLDDLRIGLVYDSAHPREHLPAPVPKFFDLLIDQCRSRFHWRSLSLAVLTLPPNLAARGATCNPQAMAHIAATECGGTQSQFLRDRC